MKPIEHTFKISLEQIKTVAHALGYEVVKRKKVLTNNNDMDTNTKQPPTKELDNCCGSSEMLLTPVTAQDCLRPITFVNSLVGVKVSDEDYTKVMTGYETRLKLAALRGEGLSIELVKRQRQNKILTNQINRQDGMIEELRRTVKHQSELLAKEIEQKNEFEKQLQFNYKNNQILAKTIQGLKSRVTMWKNRCAKMR